MHTKRETKILTIEELQDRWECIKWQLGIDKLQVTECFEMYNNRSFVVEGLSMEIEDQIAICIDWNDKIIDMDSVLKMFLIKRLTSIKLLPIENGYREELEFGNSGVIYIERAS